MAKSGQRRSWKNWKQNGASRCECSYLRPSNKLLCSTNHVKWSFNGIGSFAHLDYVKCLTNPAAQYDIAIIGAPFDTAVTFRPGISPLAALLRKRIRHINNSALISTDTLPRRSFWSPCHQTSISPPNLLPRLQPPCQHKPLPKLGQDHRLRRHSNHTFRQRHRERADDAGVQRSRQGNPI